MPVIGQPTLDQLRVLTAVADAGSFSAAARRLRRGQSVVSYTIAHLEAQLGVTLFDRAGRAPVLTQAGRALLADARRVGGAIDALRARAAALRQGLEAELSLAVDVMFPIDALVTVLRGFAEAFPTVPLRLRMEAVGGVAQLVLDDVCGLGVSGWAGTFSDRLEQQSIGEIQLVAVAAPVHPLAALASVTRAAARDHTQLVVSDGSKLTEGQDFGVIGLQTWRLGDLGAKHALLLAGLGWGNMPEHLVAGDIAAGRLVRLNIAGGVSYRYELSVIHRTDRPPGPAAAWLARSVGALPVATGI
jgi:DNA-binding transcriptional LysR family regulator